MKQSSISALVLRFCLISLLFSFSIVADEEVFSAGKNDFLLDLNGNVAPYDLRFVSLTPGSVLSISALNEEEEPIDALLVTEDGVEPTTKRGHWEWNAPEAPGLYVLNLGDRKSGQMVKIQVFVTVPFRELKKGYLRGYHIGRYPSSTKAQYSKPQGFIEVTEENQDTYVSSHFQLKQFLCKQGGAFPKYVVLDERLILKLEMILEKLNELENSLPTFEIISGYRTPGHNRGVATAKLSRHIWGDAADLLVTEDLSGDGKVDFKDSEFLREMIDQLEQENPELFPPGGIGIYKRPGKYGPYIHVDARGTSARWVNNPRRHRGHKKHRSPRRAKRA